MGTRLFATARRRATLLLVAVMGMAGGASATLIDQGNGTVLDTSTNLLWLKDANYPRTELAQFGRINAIIANVGSVAGHTLTLGDFSGANFDGGLPPGSGRMTWFGALAWAQDLTFAGFDDWRLPTNVDTGPVGCDDDYRGGTDCGYNIDPATGELARLWYVSLGNTAWYDTSGNLTGCSHYSPFCFANQDPFINATFGVYWSDTEYAPIPGGAWDFNTGFGMQHICNKCDLFAWAVRSADANGVPEPATLALVGLGLAGLGFSRRKQ